MGFQGLQLMMQPQFVPFRGMECAKSARKPSCVHPSLEVLNQGSRTGAMVQMFHGPLSTILSQRQRKGVVLSTRINAACMSSVLLATITCSSWVKSSPSMPLEVVMTGRPEARARRV